MTPRMIVMLGAALVVVLTAITILRIDQIIMSKQAGGPKAPQQGGWDNDDD